MPNTEPTVTPVHAFADRAWEQFLELNPVLATVQGDSRWDDRLDEPGPEGRAATMAVIEAWEAEIDGFAGLALSAEDSITLGLMRLYIDRLRARHALRLWEMEPIDHLDGPHAFTADLARVQQVDGPESLQRLLDRLAAYPAWMAAHRANVAEGVASGRTAAAPVLERCLTQTRRLLHTPAADHPIVAAQASIDEEGRALLAEAVREYVLPELRAWLEMLEDYASHVRAGVGVCHLPDGDEIYRYAIRSWTTVDEEPQAIHDYGYARLAEIDAQEAAIAAELGYEDVAALRAHLAVAPDNHAAEPAELVEIARELVRRADDSAPAWFGHRPQDGCEVLAAEPHVEQEAPPAFYMEPSADGSRKGRYFVNTYDPASRHLHRFAAMTFHEAVPGHHFQLAIGQELQGLPDFRLHGSVHAAMSFVEGWGLYSEQLAGEMGLYRTAHERFGALELDAWRAARLVVDTGIHALGWTRQQSIDLLLERAGLSALEAETETDRYIAWPGQALCYGIGKREILALRAQLEARDGDRFDHRAFHDEVIGHGSLPLAVLREQLPDWVEPRAD